MSGLSIDRTIRRDRRKTREREKRLSHLAIWGKIRTRSGTERWAGGREGGREEYLGYRVATCLQSEVEIRLRRIAHLHEQNHVH